MNQRGIPLANPILVKWRTVKHKRVPRIHRATNQVI
uniref:Uncharacterized protein n=1 Tax=Arundo donax TaxID=35708 RepID=A0A0A9C830_ARUDO